MSCSRMSATSPSSESNFDFENTWRLPSYAEARAQALAEESEHSSSASSSPRSYDPRVLQYIDHSAIESDDMFSP